MNNENSTDQAFIRKLNEIIQANLANENFGVDELAHASGMSRSVIYHRLLAISEKSTTQFIREVRLQRAMEMLLQEGTTASEVAYKVGFSSPAYFSTCFHEYFGYPPGEVLKNNRKEPEENDCSFADEPTTTEPEPEPKSVKLPGRKVSGKQVAIFSFIGFLIVFGLAWLLSITVFKNPNTVLIAPIKSPDKSIAVLPFINLSTEAGNQYFADGVTRDVLNNLVQIEELKVVASSPIKEFSENPLNIAKIANKLGVNFLLTGSAQKDRNRVRVSVQLIDARQNLYIWSDKYDKELSNIFLIQSDIAKQIASALQAVISTKEIERIEKIPTRNMEAYNLYLKGRYFWNRRTEDGIKRSIGYFNKAIEADPDYALAWVGLADAYSILAGYGWYTPKKEGQAKAKIYIRKAIELDKNLAEAHAAWGRMLIYHDRNWDEAEKELTLAIRLNPKDAPAHQYYSQLLDIFGENEKARKQIELAIELDPLSPIMYYISATLYYNEGNFVESLKEYQKTLSLEKNYESAYWESFLIYYRQGNGTSALDELQKILLLDSLTSTSSDVANKVYADSGLNGLIDWLIEFTLVQPKLRRTGNLAGLYAVSGKKEEAMACIEDYLKNDVADEIVRIINKRDYETLRSEPRFKAVIDQLGLTKYYIKRTQQPGYINIH